MPSRKGQPRTLPKATGAERRQRTRRSLPVTPAEHQTEPETWERTVARIAQEPLDLHVKKYREWKRNGSPHDTACRVCGATGNSDLKPGRLINCHTCRVAFHFICVPDGSEWATREDLYCPICVKRGWDMSPPELSPPASPVPAPAPIERPEGVVPIEPAVTAAVLRAVSNTDSTNGLKQPQAASEDTSLGNSSERIPQSPAVTTRPETMRHDEDNNPDPEAPQPKRQRTSRFVTLPSDVDASLGVIYRELESVASLKLQIQELQYKDRQSAQMIKLRDNSIAILRRDLEKYRADDTELARLRDNAARFDKVKREVDELKRKNELLETELRKSREETATAQRLVNDWKGKLAQLLNA
ncbi:uncharacterized protein BDW70DRAFT_166120 [Aspergillus foveolatus]|uniref:uncharacterized protein n=1 Tax=Aspergillus foveolatus TaxID=210207 RepID=UPI003CCD43F9